MQIHVVAFATASDALGHGELSVELPDGSDLGALARHLRATHPELEAIWPRLAIAVDGSLASPDARLTDGCEVALLPPVSGGMRRTQLVETPLEIAPLAAAVSRPGSGAVVLFAGTVRDHHAGSPVSGLTYTAYRPMAEERLETIATDLAAGHDLEIAIAHRLGTLQVGETSVVIATSAPHRDAAFQANREALERLKREVPIWKQEHYADGSVAWREDEPLAAPETR